MTRKLIMTRKHGPGECVPVWYAWFISMCALFLGLMLGSRW